MGETVRTTNGTKEAFRVIVLREANPQTDLFQQEHYCYHAVMTKRQEAAAEILRKHNEQAKDRRRVRSAAREPRVTLWSCAKRCTGPLPLIPRGSGNRRGGRDRQRVQRPSCAPRLTPVGLRPPSVSAKQKGRRTSHSSEKVTLLTSPER